MSALETQPAILDAMGAEQAARLELGKAMEVLTRSKAVVIETDSDYAQADGAVAAIKTAQKLAETKRTELVKPLNDTVKRINAAFKPVDATFEEALGHYRRPMSAYQARLAEERRKAEEAARIERERIAREEAAKIEAARKAEEEAAAAAKAAQESADPFAAVLAEEAAAEASQAAALATEEAKATIRELRMVEPVVPAKVTGSASKTYEVWKHEITNEAEIPDRFWVLDTAAIAREVKALKGDAKIPGVRVWSELEVK